MFLRRRSHTLFASSHARELEIKNKITIEMVTLRVRTKAGTWRFNQVDLGQTLETFIQRVEKEKSISIKKVSLKQNLTDDAEAGKTLSGLGLGHGSMIFV